MSQLYRRKSSEQWQSLVEAQQHSGLSAAKFCEQNQIAYTSFCKWKQRFPTSQVDRNERSQSDFVDLRSISPGSDKWHITLALGDGVELTLSRG
ncbi:IS66 family insertion sequence element accessory protein TnpA [Reinekea marinisedimentorum]|uniref:Transposase n=1 Tax=Reinekea marinisedimentorum TaxID=230495 RepID=A0A4R3HU17_9GAMM|nr:IS66 family insertion sequence element accessory protein TnpB [Reinekea marinisedimentorum]TCS36706.1 hypothetical protein BCF53_12330 [Reinekea marinisedimentorum]